MYLIKNLTYPDLNLSLSEMLQLSPNRLFYEHEKPPLVLLYNQVYYWCEIAQPDQTQACLIKSINTIEDLLNTTITYHEIKRAHPVIQAHFITQSRLFLSSFSHTKTLIPFLNVPSLQLEKQYREISVLPNALLQVMITKDYSLKQCYYFCRFDIQFLTAICNWVLPLLPSATQLKQCVQLLFDITRRDRLSISELISTLPRTSLAAIISVLTQRYQPTLAHHQQELELIKAGYSLPVSWDPTLEKQEVTVMATIRSTADFTSLTNQLTHPRSQEGIQKLLDHL